MIIWLNTNAINAVTLRCLLCGLTHEFMGSLCRELVMSMDRKRKSVGRHAIFAGPVYPWEGGRGWNCSQSFFSHSFSSTWLSSQANLEHLLTAWEEGASGKFTGWREGKIATDYHGASLKIWMAEGTVGLFLSIANDQHSKWHNYFIWSWTQAGLLPLPYWLQVVTRFP